MDPSPPPSGPSSPRPARARRRHWAAAFLGLAAAAAVLSGHWDGALGQATTDAGPKIRITNWSSATNFGRHASLAAPLEVTDSLCVAASDGGYLLTLYSRSGGDGFALAGGWDRIVYDVSFADDGATFRPMAQGVAVPFTSDQEKCRKGDSNAALRIGIRPDSFNRAESGVYTDVLTAIFAAL